jgi:hypothetical protein
MGAIQPSDLNSRWTQGCHGRTLGPVERRAHVHRHAAVAHDEAASRHAEAALFWVARGDEIRADLERRNAEIERAAAVLERDRADLDDGIAKNGTQPSKPLE